MDGKTKILHHLFILIFGLVNHSLKTTMLLSIKKKTQFLYPKLTNLKVSQFILTSIIEIFL